jgi:hypothetical protein
MMYHSHLNPAQADRGITLGHPRLREYQEMRLTARAEPQEELISPPAAAAAAAMQGRFGLAQPMVARAVTEQ